VADAARPRPVSTGFTAGERHWQARLGNLRNIVRQELLARQLAQELPPPPVRIIDLGCGQGTQALRLARRGYEVTGVDASGGLLARFERDLAAETAETAEVRARVRVEQALIEDYPERAGYQQAGVVLCHGADVRSRSVSAAAGHRRAQRADLTGRLAGYGLEVTAWYGVRVFTDTADDDAPPPTDLAALLDCEERAGRTDPYRQVAALLHLVARRAL
jgi:S-adenosylmethionine-dependent methyltransferase